MPDQANMAVRDGDYDIVYIAGEMGGLYKYFPASGEIYLMLGIDSGAGERGRFVGYAALTKKIPVSGVLEIVFMPKGGADLVWHFVPGDDWVSKPPPMPGVAWTDLIINPLNANQWCAWERSNPPYESRRVFVTNDNGLTWTRVPMPTAAYLQVTGGHWSRHESGFLWLVGSRRNSGTFNGATIWYGNPFTGEMQENEIVAPRRTSKIYSFVVADDGVITLRSASGGNLGITDRYLHTVTPAGVKTLVNGDLDDVKNIFWLPLIGTNNILGIQLGSVVLGSNRRMWYALTPTGTLVDTGLDIASEDEANSNHEHGWIDVIEGMRWFAGRHQNGIQEITNPFASPSIITSYAEGQHVGAVRADAQTRTTLASVIVPAVSAPAGTLSVLVFKDGAWSTMGGPPTAYPNDISSVALSPIVRPE